MEKLASIGQGTVELFLENINDNFTKIENDENIKRAITFSTSEPNAQTAGNNGDIWIVYEQINV